MRRVQTICLDVLINVLGCTAYAIGFDLFLEPNNIAPGGVTGLGLVFVKLTGLGTIGLFIAVVNIPLFLAGWRHMGRKFFFGSLLGMAASSFLIDLLVMLLPHITVEPLLSAIYGGVLVGLGCGLVFSRGASTGGGDILARLLKLKLRNLSIGKLMLAIDLVIAVINGIAFQDLNKTLYSAVALYCSSIVMDGVIYGFDYSKVALIISDYYAEIADGIEKRLERGCTLLHGQGAYTNAEKKVILCAVKNQQLSELKDLVTELDPGAFIILEEAHQVLGDGFRRYSRDDL